MVYTRTGEFYQGINSVSNPQPVTANLPVDIAEGDLMVLMASSRGPAHTITTLGWNQIERIETSDGTSGGQTSFLIAYRVRQAGDTQVIVTRTNTTSRLANLHVLGFRANRTGGAWGLDGSVTTRGVAVADSFTATGMNAAGTDTLLMLHTFAGVTPYDNHKVVSSSLLPYVLSADVLPRIKTRGWNFHVSAGWTPGAQPVTAQWQHVMHMPEQTSTGDITYTLGDTTSPRLAVHHSAVVTAFRYMGGVPT